ncbi:hypothetical protein CASFOL_035825 [Castilleja foliolosa]|uniref:WRKY19-like zinc finger domain-containing protein n=1 Tax=Castilleja foliolosa TaxID=1961234 RepID=A0ABD3BUL2_9LAMI
MDRSDTSGFVSGGAGPSTTKMFSSFTGDIVNNINFGDTTLRLDGFGYGMCDGQTNGNGQNTLDDGCKLVLGLGPTPSAYSNEYLSNKANGLTPVSSQRDSILQLGLSGISDSVSNSLDFDTQASVADEGSTSAKKSGGYIRSLIMAPRMENVDIFSTKSSSEPPESGNTVRNTKRCVFTGCTKGARGATGMCISHGGGPRCQKPGCNKGAESRTAYCKAHGGGKRCQHLGCTKSAEGKTDNCIAHGGGKRCGYPSGCGRAARGKSGLCIRHGGGKRCAAEGCTRSAEGQIGLCISHGGGRRCRTPGCTKGAQGSTDFCKAHGGGKRCVFTGCTKGAEGSTPLCKGHGGGKRCSFEGGGMCPKSVHGGTNFCVAHGGGKRCSVLGCTKSARGRTDCCVKHGDGKRCRVENCGKSAQGSTDFCKAHGGGNRCGWGGEGKCEKFARGKSGLCAAHCSLVNGRETKRVGSIGPGLFCGLVDLGRSSFDNTCSSSGVSVISDSVMLAERQQLIPAQVLVPLSMKGSSSSYLRPLGSEKQQETGLFSFVVPEGRVHGGGLMSMLGGNINNAIDGI